MAPAHALALSDALCGVDHVDALVGAAGDGALRVADGAGRRPAYYAAKRGPGAAAAFDADGADGRRRRRELRDDGFTVVRVGERAAAELARETSAVLDHCLAAPDLDVFGTIRTPDNRYDVKAALTPKLRAVLADLAADLPWLAAAPVTQLSAVHSDPGAPLQTPHSDTRFIRDDAPRLYTALVALTPVSPEKGPVCKSTTGTPCPAKTSNLSSSIKSKSIRLIFGRIDCSRQVLEAQLKSLVRTVQLRAR